MGEVVQGTARQHACPDRQPRPLLQFAKVECGLLGQPALWALAVEGRDPRLDSEAGVIDGLTPG